MARNETSSNSIQCKVGELGKKKIPPKRNFNSKITQNKNIIACLALDLRMITFCKNIYTKCLIVFKNLNCLIEK